MALGIATVTNSLAAVSVSGVTLKDVDEVKAGLTQRDCPLLTPNPDNFISNFSITPDAMGAGSGRKMTAKYTINYILIQAQVGAGRRDILENYSGMIDNAAAVFDAVVKTDNITGSVDLLPRFGESYIYAMGGNDFHAINIMFDVTEFVN